MVKKLIALIFIVGVVSCKKETAQQSPLEGKWQMTDYVDMLPVAPALKPGDVTWTFDGQGVLNVVNNVENDYPFLITNGSYSYQIINGELFLLGNVYQFNVSGSPINLELQDNKGFTDAPMRTFIKTN